MKQRRGILVAWSLLVVSGLAVCAMIGVGLSLMWLTIATLLWLLAITASAALLRRESGPRGLVAGLVAGVVLFGMGIVAGRQVFKRRLTVCTEQYKPAVEQALSQPGVAVPVEGIGFRCFSATSAIAREESGCDNRRR